MKNQRNSYITTVAKFTLLLTALKLQAFFTLENRALQLKIGIH